MPKSGVDVGLEKEGAKLHLEFTKFLQIFIVGGYLHRLKKGNVENQNIQLHLYTGFDLMWTHRDDTWCLFFRDEETSVDMLRVISCFELLLEC